MVHLYVTVGFYAVNLAFFYLWLLPSIGSGISEKCSSIRFCNRHIRETWLRYDVDGADGQWREFRGSLWLLWICLTISAAVNSCIRTLCHHGIFRAKHSVLLQNVARLIFGIIFLVVQHGYHSLIVASIAIVGYMMAMSLKGYKSSIYVVWTYGLLILLFKESYRVRHHPGLQVLQPLFDRRYGGMYGWQLPANFLILRLISFCLDYNNACVHYDDTADRKLSARECAIQPAKIGSEHLAVDATEVTSPLLELDPKGPQIEGTGEQSAKESNYLELSQYNFLNFSVYVLYAPLYMAGPIITFNDFVISTRDAEQQKGVFPWMYCFRWLYCFALMEFLTNMFPLFAVLNSGLFFQLSVSEMAVAAYVTLKLMWLKFLLLWRFCRLWALTDGVAAPENMLRCMSNNYSLEQFWKGWHASFNKWIVTYLYLPLGGRKNRILAVWAVFLFVAVWHDIELKLLVWGALNSVFFVIEVLAKRVSRTPAMQGLPPALVHLIGSLSGALYIMVLIAVNLVGYAIGVDGLSGIYSKMVTWEGLRVLTVAFYFLAVGTSLMIVLEQRKGKGCPVSGREEKVGME